MGGRKKKPYIDKKNATTYRLVHRSQHDPLAADNDANQMVLDEIGVAATSDADLKKQSEDSRLAQQRAHGVYYEDEYNYMQHLKDKSEGDAIVWEAVNPTRPGKVELPVCVLPSVTEEPVGLLNLAAPRGLDLSLDPDVVAALDDDFDFEDPEMVLEDNFIELAEGAADLDDISEEGSCYSGEYDDDIDSLGNFSGCGSLEEKARFTEYSVSSSVLPRNEGLTMLDDKFEEMFKEYDELGAGEEDLVPVDELNTAEPTLVLQQLCEEFERQDIETEEDIEVTKKITLQLAEKQVDKPDKTSLVTEDVDEKKRIAWDCETILSTYTNIYNHPKLINIPPKIKLNKKGIVIEEKEETEPIEEQNSADEGIEISDDNQITISNLRTQNETAEERKARKKAVKENQRIRRQIKKATKEVFKEERDKVCKTNVNITNQSRTIKL